MKSKPEKNSGLNGIRTRDLYDAGAVLYQLSYQAILELLSLRVRNMPIDDEENNEYMNDHVFELRKKI